MANWTAESILQLARAYQPTCVLAAAVDFGVFDVLAADPMTALEVARRLRADERGVVTMLDALTGLELLEKQAGRYGVPPDVRKLLTEDSRESVLPGVRHQANCLRRWVQLSQVVLNGRPAERTPSIRGQSADEAAFIAAMHNFSGPEAGAVLDDIGPLQFKHLLDIGGASGTWTIEFLRRVPGATATLFDLPAVIPLAASRLADTDLTPRVQLVAGDFYTDALPPGADLAWLSAIAHQNSRAQNRALYHKIHEALNDGGDLLIRDIVMSEEHTRPVAGTLFAINMLVATEGGGTFSLSEFREDLEAAGFRDVQQLRQDQWMHSVVRARKV